MSGIYHIAVNTFRESARDRMLYVIFGFAAITMLASLGLGWVSVGEELQVVQDFSFGAMSFFGALLAVFSGTGLIFKEIDKRTIYTVLSKPVRRWQFVLGKYAGLMGILALCLAGMTVAALLAATWSAATGPMATPDWAARIPWVFSLKAAFLIYVESGIVTALAILFSSVSSPILSAVFTFCGYLIGQVSSTLAYMFTAYQAPEKSVAAQTGERLSDWVAAISGVLKPMSEALFYLLPDLGQLHVFNRLVHGPDLRPGTATCLWLDGEVGQLTLYGAGYAAAALLLACLLFERRRF